MDAPGPALAADGSWYRQPVLWLAIVLLLAVIAGCVSMIVLGARHADEPVPVAGDPVFKVPTARPAAAKEGTAR